MLDLLSSGLIRSATAALAAVAGLLLVASASARPIATHEGVLPAGSELNEDALDQPTELFKSKLAGGKRSYLLNLGDMAFGSPSILGGVARKAGISCDTCHQQGANNAKLYIPGLSSRPGTFDATNALFQPHADNGVLDAVTPPSLRGARYLAPYAHDGRFGTLREFIRNAIVNEFDGPEPSAQILDALVAYVQEISFLPNAKLGAGGQLTAAASAAALRGEALFHKPFPHNPARSCAGCHVPSSAFVDHTVHDVGSGGFFKTPTLVNADFNAPYFHDGRFDSYSEVVQYFDRAFDLGLSQQDRSDLVDYLDAIGGADKPYTRSTLDSALREIADFGSVLTAALPEHNLEAIDLTADSVGNEWRELGENFPEATNPVVTGGREERAAARRVVLRAALSLRQIAMAAEASDYATATQAYGEYRKAFADARPMLKAAEPWSLFERENRNRYLSALNALDALAAPKSSAHR